MFFFHLHSGQAQRRLSSSKTAKIIITKIRNYRNFRKIRRSCRALVIFGNNMQGYSSYICYDCQLKSVEGLNENYEFYLNYENCEKSQFS